ncbi:zf-HC2 domain-containing protein [Sutcliffiella deserti]|uniref:zf-HC2 domain-containing protein n=1 Tax=Sutcliffiella deserti TaxID=2875501 RepID=UPI001CC067EC|nr:sigma factor [Sutcliffiella deserti]
MRDETTLIEDILKGDKEAFDSIIELYKNRLYAVTLRMAGSESKAEEIVAGSFIAAYQNIHTYKNSGIFSEWFYRETIRFIQKETFSSGKLLPEEYIQFFNPNYLEIEEAIISLNSTNRLEFLLVNALGERAEKIADYLEKDKELVEKRYQESLFFIREKLLAVSKHKTSGECLSVGVLTDYFDAKLKGLEIERVEDHLEFCPPCRDVLDSLKMEKKSIENVIHTPKLEDTFNRKVLGKVEPYTPKVAKHRTWKYQLSVIGVLAAIFFISAVVIPSLKPLAGKVATYMEYGTIYNVWTEGTYKATDKDLTFEVTGVDIDPLHMIVYYNIKNEKRDIDMNNSSDFDFYETTAVRIEDEDGNIYPVEVSHPLTGLYNGMRQPTGDQKEDEALNRPSFAVKAVKEEELPDRFTLRFQFRRIQNTSGNWEVEVPIRYDKINKSLEIVELDEVMVIDDKIEIEFLSMAYGSNGSRLTYQVRFREEEKERLGKIREEAEEVEEHLAGYWSQGNFIHAGILAVNQDGDYMMPIYYQSYMMEPDSEKPIHQDFSRYYFDYHSYELKGKEEAVGKYSAEVRNVQYEEPTFISLKLPLEETEDKLLDMDLDDIKEVRLTVEKLDHSNENKNKYKVTVKGTKVEGLSHRQYHWNVVGENDEYLEVSYMGHMEESSNGEVEMVNLEVVTSLDETNILLQSYGAYNYYEFEEGEKVIPLFEEEEE